MSNTINGEPAYPIYSFSAKWHEPESVNTPPLWKIGLPPGRMWNATGFNKMFKEEPDQKELDFFLIDWWSRRIEEKKHKDCSIPILAISFVEHEVWCLDWFQHHTFDIGQTNAEALESFSRFVMRKERLIREKGENAYCLMGAEDRWRWSGAEQGELPPCRCSHCKEQGVIRIGH